MASFLNFEKLRFYRGRPIAVSESTVQTLSSVAFSGRHRAPGKEPSDFGLLFVCQRKLTEFFLQSSPSLVHNSVSSFLQDSTLETAFRPFPNFGIRSFWYSFGFLQES